MVEAELPLGDPTAERTRRHTAILAELAEIGMDLARRVQRQAAEDARPDLAVAFSRIARAVRLTLALETRITEEGFAQSQRLAEDRQKARERAGFIERVRLGQREATVHRLVSEAIEIEGQETERQETDEVLLDALNIQMAGLDVSDHRSIGQIVAGICKDLGVTIDWTYCQDEPWAREERQTRPAGSPFANGVPDPVWPDHFHEDPPPKPPPRQATSPDGEGGG